MPGVSLKEFLELRLDDFVDTVRVPSGFCLERDVCCNCLESVESKSVDDASASSTHRPELEEERYNNTYMSTRSLPWQHYCADKRAVFPTCWLSGMSCLDNVNLPGSVKIACSVSRGITVKPLQSQEICYCHAGVGVDRIYGRTASALDKCN